MDAKKNNRFIEFIKKYWKAILSGFLLLSTLVFLLLKNVSQNNSWDIAFDVAATLTLTFNLTFNVTINNYSGREKDFLIEDLREVIELVNKINKNIDNIVEDIKFPTLNNYNHRDKYSNDIDVLSDKLQDKTVLIDNQTLNELIDKILDYLYDFKNNLLRVPPYKLVSGTEEYYYELLKQKENIRKVFIELQGLNKNKTRKESKD